MSILIDQENNVLVQGITGWQGSRSAKYMLDYGTNVVAGVTPGKAGNKVHGIPVYNTIKQASKHHLIDASVVMVPPQFVREAVLEAIQGKIDLINIVTERVPQKDVSEILLAARDEEVRIVGPNSQGIISPGKAKLGGTGGDDPSRMFSKGPIGVISRSGGMGAEICWSLTREGIGQSTYVSIGGDPLIGSSFTDILELFRDDKETKIVVLFGEPGTIYEEKAAEFIKKTGYPKPVVAYITGAFVDRTTGKGFGHAGTIVSRGKGSRQSKVEALKNAGVTVVKKESFYDLPKIVSSLLNDTSSLPK